MTEKNTQTNKKDEKSEIKATNKQPIISRIWMSNSASRITKQRYVI